MYSDYNFVSFICQETTVKLSSTLFIFLVHTNLIFYLATYLPALPNTFITTTAVAFLFAIAVPLVLSLHCCRGPCDT